jgi:hypothetical protein
VTAPYRDNEISTSRATANLPGLAIELVHRRPTGDCEQLSLTLRAMPSFESCGRWIEAANPLFWSRAAGTAWLPWLLVRMMMLPLSGAVAPQFRGPGSDTDREQRHAAG